MIHLFKNVLFNILYQRNTLIPIKLLLKYICIMLNPCNDIFIFTGSDDLQSFELDEVKCKPLLN